MKENCYEKGSRFTFPLELTELEGDFCFSGREYLYPVEVMEIKRVIEEYCDRMEYDGSVMYDEYPDKTSVERISEKICEEKTCKGKGGIDERWMKALVQVLLCSEMSFRRERRHHHKKNLPC